MATADEVHLDTGEENGNPWTPLKDLAAVVEAAVLRHQPGLQPDLESALCRHKSQFVSLLKNPIRNSSDAALVRKASSEGIKLSMGEGGSSMTQRLPAQMVDEAFIISDMFELNEISALQLLIQAEDQLCQYPGLTRGLVAVLLYYDGQRCVVQALRTLIQGRHGITWTLGTSIEVSEFITNYTEDLLKQGLVDKIITLLGDMDWTKEAIILQRNLALGDAKHRRLVQNLYEDVRQGLADCLFAYAAQSGLPRSNMLRLLEHVAKIKPIESGPQGDLEDVHLTLTMALLYGLSASAINKDYDNEELMKILPILSDPNFIPALHRELGPGQSRRWLHPALQAIVQFAWSMSLATIRSSTIQLPSAQNILDDEEAVLDIALDNGLFHCLPHCLITKKTVTGEEFYFRRIHQLITDLIVLMPLKVKELRNRADEGARNKMIHENEGIIYTVPLSGQHLEHLLNSIATLYANNDLGLSLNLEYWCSTAGDSSNERYPARQVALSKFVRLTGDLLLPTLFKPYVEMLVSLSGHPEAALHCFNLLKSNVGSSTVSWEHFFSSLHQYFANLRQESQYSSMDTIYRVAARPMTRGISPAEVFGLVSVLRLITSVCTQSEMARVAIAENPNWQPVLVLVGLLSCSVPAILKSEVLKTLASLAKTPEIGQVIWLSLESAQLIVQGGRAGIRLAQQQPHYGLLNELQDVECRNEEYPLSRAFLSLLHVLLTNKSVPATVSVHPYVAFVRDQIFLRFNARPYKRPEEKWEVGCLALKIIHSLLSEYEPSEQDLDEKSINKHPGFLIMADLMQMSEMLRQLLFILDEGCNLLDKYVDFAGKENLEEACLNVLLILERGLKLQPKMLEVVRATGTRRMLNPLDKLLLGLNPRSGKPDHMFNIVKFIVFAWWLPKHGLRSVNILRHVASSASAQPLLLANFTQSELTGNMIIKGFTEMLENDTTSCDEDGDSSEEDARIAVINLLLHGLAFPAPSLSHFLLGFDLRNIARSTIQPPGVLGAVRSPLHAIIAMLRPSDSKSPSPVLTSLPHLAEFAFRLIYTLSLNNQTSEPILRFLRSSEDFLNQQLSVLPLPKESVSVYSARAISWLLKTVAIELKILSQTRQRSLITRMTMLLLDGRRHAATSGSGQDDDLGGESALTQLSRVMHHSAVGGHRLHSKIHRLLAQLNAIDFADVILQPPVLNIFDPSQVSNVLKDLETTSKLSGARAVDIKALHSVLTENLQGPTMGQKQMIEDEIQRILTYAVRWNSRQEHIMTQRNLLDSWRQVTEILLCCVPLDILPSSAKQQLLLELLQVLLNKVLSEGALAELANPVSGVVILLLASLRQTYATAAASSVEGPDQADAFVSVLDSLQAADQPRAGERPTSGLKMYSTALQVILKGLITWIIETSSSAQRARANLYGALLYYLRIGCKEESTSTDTCRLKKANIDVLSSFGDVLIDVICRDAVSGHDVRKMLALSLLDSLSALDGGGGQSGSWLWYMSRQGYLRHIIESLVLEDQQLAHLVASAHNEQIKALYTYESKMALLTRLASTTTGAELLLETGLMLRLAEMSVFSARPESMPGDDGPMARYQHILFPALRLCQALLSSLGSSNRSVTAQVIHFIGANDCLVREVLHYKDLFTPSGLQEMALLSAVLARCAWIDVNDANVYTPEVSAHLNRVQRQLLSLISHFGSSNSALKKTSDSSRDAQFVLEAHVNTILFARNFISKGASSSRLIFAPSLAEAMSRGDGHGIGTNHNVAFSNRPPSLGHLLMMIRHLADHLLTSEDNLKFSREKLASINVLGLAELAVYLPTNVADKLSTSDRRVLASNKMKEDIVRFEHDIKLSGEAVESGLFLLWKHLEHFLNTSNLSERSDRDEFSGIPGVTSNTIEQLCKDSAVCLDNSFFVKIVEVDRIYSNKKDGFLEALLRRLKRLSILRV